MKDFFLRSFHKSVSLSHGMRRIQIITPFFAVLLVLAAGQALACEGCFHLCYDYTKDLKALKEPAKSIALALWFGAYSTKADGNTAARKPPAWVGSDERIEGYLKFWNTHAPHVPIAKAERTKQRYRPHELEKITLPLPPKGKAVFVHVATRHTKPQDSYGNFSLGLLSVQPVSGSVRGVPQRRGGDGHLRNGGVSTKLGLQFFFVALKTVGGKGEWGLGSKHHPELLLDETIEIGGKQAYDLKTQERLLKELKKHKKAGRFGVVLKVTVIYAPKGESRDKKAQLIISRRMKPQEKKPKTPVNAAATTPSVKEQKPGE